jgi:hypothetical protein
VIDNRGHVDGWPVGASTTDYAIRDFDIAQLPEKNPIQRVIDEFVSRRHNFTSNKSGRSGNTSAMDICSSSQQSYPMRLTKPRLEEFLKTFQEQVLAVNEAYATSKQHLETMMA